MDDDERKLWIMNEEGLYREWIRSRLSMTKFCRENRKAIDALINSKLNPIKPPRPF
jgi:hypothetical protein